MTPDQENNVATAPVVVTMRAAWNSGSSRMTVNISFGAPSLEEALRRVKLATDAAPLFKNPLNPEEESS